MLPTVLVLCLAAQATTPASSAPASAASEVATLIGFAAIPGDALDRSGLQGEVMEGVPHARLGSLGSGIDLADTFPGGAHLLAVGDRGPADGAAAFQCRVHRLSLSVDPSKSPAVAVTLDTTHLLRRPDGTPFIGLAAELETTPLDGGSLQKRLDPESVRRLPSGNLLVSEEYGPLVLEFDAAGAFVRRWPVPERFRCAHPGPDEAAELPPHNATGRQPNKGFEGLALTPSGAAWALPQAPLLQDGALDARGKRVGVHVRLARLAGAPAPGEPSAASAPLEFVYRLESPKNGLCEALAIDERRFLVIERDGSDARFRRVYLIDTREATDVARVDSLAADTLPQGVTPVTKRLVVDLRDPAHGISSMPEKIEGLCFGPTLADGRRTLVVSSDNDMKADQPTWFWVFALPRWVTASDTDPAAPHAVDADSTHVRGR